MSVYGLILKIRRVFTHHNGKENFNPKLLVSEGFYLSKLEEERLKKKRKKKTFSLILDLRFLNGESVVERRVHFYTVL